MRLSAFVYFGSSLSPLTVLPSFKCFVYQFLYFYFLLFYSENEFVEIDFVMPLEKDKRKSHAYIQKIVEGENRQNIKLLKSGCDKWYPFNLFIVFVCLSTNCHPFSFNMELTSPNLDAHLHFINKLTHTSDAAQAKMKINRFDNWFDVLVSYPLTLIYFDTPTIVWKMIFSFWIAFAMHFRCKIHSGVVRIRGKSES